MMNHFQFYHLSKTLQKKSIIMLKFLMQFETYLQISKVMIKNCSF